VASEQYFEIVLIWTSQPCRFFQMFQHGGAPGTGGSVAPHVGALKASSSQLVGLNPAPRIPKLKTGALAANYVKQAFEPTGSPDFPILRSQPRADSRWTDRRLGDGNAFDSPIHVSKIF